MLLGTFYRPNQNDLTNLHELRKSLQNIGSNFDKSNVILAGDFNQPNIDWNLNCISGNHASSEAASP